MAAASITGSMAMMGMTSKVLNSKMPQNASTKTNPSDTTALTSDPATITPRQSLALSATRPTSRLSTIMIKIGVALMMPISSSPIPLPSSHTGKSSVETPIGRYMAA